MGYVVRGLCAIKADEIDRKSVACAELRTLQDVSV